MHFPRISSNFTSLQVNRDIGFACIGSALITAVIAMTLALLMGGAHQPHVLKLVGSALAITAGPFLIGGIALVSIAKWKMSRLTISLDAKKIN